MTQADFFNTYAPIAVNDSLFSGIPPSITLAQAALESGWGESGLTQKANNFFGIKKHDWTGPVYNAGTHEYYNSNSPTAVRDDFRVYGSDYESFMDHSKFLHQWPRYSSLFLLDFLDYKGWARGLENAGYATSPDYNEKLEGIIEKYGLQQYDLKAANLRTLKNISIVLAVLAAAYLVYVLFFKG